MAATRISVFVETGTIVLDDGSTWTFARWRVLNPEDRVANRRNSGWVGGWLAGLAGGPDGRVETPSYYRARAGEPLSAEMLAVVRTVESFPVAT